MRHEHQGELTAVQFLRGFCAIAVVVGHCAAMLSKPKYGALSLWDGILESGSMGVDIFFIISGFIMAVVVLEGPALEPRLTPSAFAWRRLIRIVPMMWIAILSYALLQYLFARDVIDLAAYGRALFLWPVSYVKPDIIWTLRQELIFYALFALAFMGPRVMRLLLWLWVLSPVAYVATLGSMGATTAYIDSFASILFSSVNIEFGAGLILGLGWVRRPPARTWRLPVHPFLFLGILLSCVLAGIWHLGLVSQSLAAVSYFVFAGGFLVTIAARAHCPPGRLTTFGRLLGDGSYAIYLFHLHVLAGLLAIRAKISFPQSAPMTLLVACAAAIGASILIHILVERPLLSRLRKAGPGRQRRGAVMGEAV